MCGGGQRKCPSGQATYRGLGSERLDQRVERVCERAALLRLAVSATRAALEHPSPERLKALCRRRGAEFSR